MEQRERLLGAITDWLEAERTHFCAEAARLRLPFQVAVSVTIGRATDERRSEYRQEKRLVSSMAGTETAALLWLNESTLRPRPTPAEVLLRTYGNKCRVWHPLPSARFEDQPIEHIDVALLRPIRSDYLTGVASLDAADHVLARNLADGLLQLIEGDFVDLVTFLPVGGLRLRGELSVANVVARPLTGEELGRVHGPLSPATFANRRRGADSIIDFGGVRHERCALITRTRCRKDEQPGDDHYTQRFVLALQLAGLDLHGRGDSGRWTEPGPSLAGGGHSFTLPERGQTKDCGAEDLAAAVALSTQIPVAIFERRDRADRVGVALYRFELGAAEALAGDAIVDFTTTLEAILLPATKEGEYRFKFALRGARWLGSSPDERTRIFRDLRRVYDLRSALVHGAQMPGAAETEEIHTIARELCGRVLTKGLRDGFPQGDDLNAIVLA